MAALKIGFVVVGTCLGRGWDVSGSISHIPGHIYSTDKYFLNVSFMLFFLVSFRVLWMLHSDEGL